MKQSLKIVAFVVALLASSFAAFAAQPLSPEEAEDLTFMREEEKLARDVYVTLHQAWGGQIFENIAASEQNHTDAIARLLEKYGLSDPMLNDAPGMFVNQDLQSLYDQLVAKGMESRTAALGVGALIEETDIRDIAEALARTHRTDIIRVYEELMRGSHNHLRAFVDALANAGISYTAQVLDQEVVESIVTSPAERGGRRTQ